MTRREPEIHLFILWENALPHRDRILADLSRRFDVLDVLCVTWPRQTFAEQLTRFYGQSLPPGSEKERECGTGPFLLVVVRDRDPRYGRRRQWGRHVVVNTRMFDAKQRYRRWAGGGHRVHSTTKGSETDHDLFFLLGRRASFYAGGDGPRWDGRVVPWRHDPVGTGGWGSRAELLTAVEVTLAYVLLPDPPRDAGGRPALRVLVEGVWENWGVEWLVASPEAAAAPGPYHRVVVAGEEIVLELRHVGDGTFAESWQRAMLRDRVRDGSGAFVLSDEHRFWALLHDSVARREEPSSAALGALREAASAAGIDVDLSDRAATRNALDEFLARVQEREAALLAAVPTREPSRLAAAARVLLRRA